MVIGQLNVDCSKCGKKHAGMRFFAIEGHPAICDFCIAEALGFKNLKPSKEYLKAYPDAGNGN